jgi:hypothetical protein
MKLEPEVRKMGMAGKTEEALTKVDAFITDNKLEGRLKQQALFMKLGVYPPSSEENLNKAEAVLDVIVAVDATTPVAMKAKQIKEQILPRLRQRLQPQK